MNDWCQALGIAPPKLEQVAGHREANTFSLLLIALLEQGRPMTLAEVAARFERADIAQRDHALLSLQRCQPGRPPVYRDGDLYHLDPHDDELDLWIFRLGLKPAQFVNVSWPQRRAVRGAALDSLSRALLVTYPAARPRAAVLLDVGEHTIETFSDTEFDALHARLADYEVLGGVDIRAKLRGLGFEPGSRRLADLAPPRKTRQLNKRGRPLRITTALLVQGSCGISKPFGEEDKLANYLARGQMDRLLRRLEADAKSLHALYEYGRLHGAVRLRWGFVDERIPAPWVHRDEPTLLDLKRSALVMDVPLEVVVGSAPAWSEPWSRACVSYVEKEPDSYREWLIDEDGRVILDADVQRARLSVAVH